MSKGHKLSIMGEGLVGSHYRVWLDDHELTGLNSLKLEMGVSEANWVTLKLLVGELHAVPPIGPYSEGWQQHVAISGDEQ